MDSLKKYRVRLGVVGFSAKNFDQEAAKRFVAEGIERFIQLTQASPGELELVSGLTNQGVPKLAYEYAALNKIRTIGISAQKAKRFAKFPVDRIEYHGKDFGDESPAFIDYITHLLRVGGGKQSRHEVELFKAKIKDVEPLSDYLLEYEVEWLGTHPPSLKAPVPPLTAKRQEGLEE
jgi:hypothetical protein